MQYGKKSKVRGRNCTHMEGNLKRRAAERKGTMAVLVAW